MVNTLKVGLLLTALTALFLWIGGMLGGQTGIIIAFILAVVMNFGSYWFSDKLVLAATRAQPVDPSRAPELTRMVERLSERAEIPTPRLYIVPDPTPNAFATGRSPRHGVVAVNQGLLDHLSWSEVEGVVAHEIAHIKHRDTLTMAVTATLAGAVMMIANILQFAAFFAGGDEDSPNPLVLLVVAMFAPIAAMLIQMAVSRSREFEADRAAADYIGTGRGLASALQNLQRGNSLPHRQTVPMNRAHMYISNPLSGRGLAGLFSTHPATEARVEALMRHEASLARRA